MKKFILVFSFIFTSCNLIPDKVNVERIGFINGCTEGSKQFIEMTIRRELPYSQLQELRKICEKIYGDYKGLK